MIRLTSDFSWQRKAKLNEVRPDKCIESMKHETWPENSNTISSSIIHNSFHHESWNMQRSWWAMRNATWDMSSLLLIPDSIMRIAEPMNRCAIDAARSIEKRFCAAPFATAANARNQKSEIRNQKPCAFSIFDHYHTPHNHRTRLRFIHGSGKRHSCQICVYSVLGSLCWFIAARNQVTRSNSPAKWDVMIGDRLLESMRKLQDPTLRATES